MQETHKPKLKILGFEDDEFLARMYREKFRREGFEASIVSSPPDDVVGFVLHEDPDVIISNMLMPRMDGFGLIQRLKADERTRGIPFIFLTTLSQKEQVSRGMAMGAAAYWIKANLTPSEVVSGIRKIIREQGRRPRLRPKAASGPWPGAQYLDSHEAPRANGAPPDGRQRKSGTHPVVRFYSGVLIIVVVVLVALAISTLL